MSSPFISPYAEYHESGATGYNLGEHLWYGAMGSIASAVDSVRNSVAWVANGGGDYDKIYTEDTLRNFDDNAAEYYNQHQSAVDVVGFVAGAIIPGSYAIKAAKMLQLGKGGAAMTRVNGLLGSQRQSVINGALAEMKTAAGGISGQVKAAKYRAGIMGLKDNLVQSVFAEAAVVATMHQSPIFDEMDTKDMVINSLLGIGLGTGIGAGLDYFANASQLKKALRVRETKLRPYEAGGEVGAVNITMGDRVSKLVEHLENLPAVRYADAYAPAQAATREATVKETVQKIQAAANDMANGEAYLGKALADKVIAEWKAGGTADDIYNLFGNSTKLSRVGAKDAARDDIFYIRRQWDKPTPVTSFSDVISTQGPIASAEADIAYKRVPGQEAPRFTYVGLDPAVDSVAAGYKADYDLVIDANHVVHVNPGSTRIERAARPGEDQVLSARAELRRKQEGIVPEKGLTGSMYINLHSGAYADSVKAGASDIFDISAAKLVNKGEELVGDGSVIARFSDDPFAGLKDITKEFDPIAASARWSLAAKRGLKDGDEIAETDLPFLVAAATGAEIPPLAKLPGDLANAIETAVRNTFDDMTFQGADMDDIAQALHLPRSFVDNLDFSWPKLSEIYNNPEWMSFASKPLHVKVTYKIGNDLLPTAGMTVRGMAQVQSRIKLAEETNRLASSVFFGDTFNVLPDFLKTLRSSASATEGAGSTLLTNADGNYGSLASATQQIGQVLHKFKVDKLNSLVSRLSFSGSSRLIENQAAATEFGLIAHAVQSTGAKYGLVRNIDGRIVGVALHDVAAQINGTKLTEAADIIAELQTKLGQVGAKQITLPDGFVLSSPTKGQKTAFIPVKDKIVGDILAAHHQTTSEFADQITRFYAVQGISKRLDPNDLYFAPVDTARFQHVAFIRSKQGGFGNTNNVGAIYGRDLEEFQRNIARINTDDYEIILKRDSELYHKAQGDWDYSLAVNDNTADAFAKREGMMAEFYPTLNGKELIERQLDYYRKQVTRITNNYAELHYAREFEELRTLGDAYMGEALSVSRRTAKGFEATIDDPFRSYIKTALDQSRLNEHRMWSESAEKVDAFVSSAFRRAKDAFGLAAKGDIDFEAANDAAEKAGLGRIYENMAGSLFDQTSQFASYQGSNYGRQVLTKFVSTANSALAAVTLRLDVANAIINTISMPVLMGPELKSILRNLDNPEIVGKLQGILSYGIPGGDNKVPSATKLVYGAVKAFFGQDRRVLLEKYKSLGLIRNQLDLYHDMLDDIAVTGYEAPKLLEKAATAIVEKGAKLTGNETAEEFTRFVSAHVMDQLTQAAGLDARTSAAYMNTFVNRVNGVHLASQRPVIFQGPIGQAIGLFQTYQFNLMQNVFRHAQNGSKKELAMLMGLQGSIFGLQGLPGFQTINQHLVGTMRGNPEHKDFYSEAPEWLMYGSASWLSDTALYTRGDITPRNMTVVPLLPSDTPIGNATASIVNNFIDAAKNLSNGASIKDTLLFALEHNGVSRPLSGLAVSIQGERTTSKGSLIAKNLDFLSLETAMRVVGSKPIDEAIAMDANYRMLAYRAHDKELRAGLGKALKIKLLGGDEISQEEMEEAAVTYAKYGGSQEGFNRWFINLTKGTTESVANQLAAKVNSPLGRRMQEIMGGEELPDYRNSPDQEAQE